MAIGSFRESLGSSQEVAPRVLAFSNLSSWTSTAIKSEAPKVLAICKQLKQQPQRWLVSCHTKSSNKTTMTQISNIP